MPEPRPDPRRDHRAVAVLTALAFGCATVRVPAGQIADPIPVRDGVAEPQVALVIEDSKGVDPAESARATQTTRAALADAIAEQGAVDGDAILVVRAQGVTRTRSRRSDQRLAVAGMVVGAVVVVAAVVAAVVATRGKGGGGSRASSSAAKPAAVTPASAPRAAPAPAPRAPVRAAPAPRAAPQPPPPVIARPGGVRPAPAPGAAPIPGGDGHAHGAVDVSVGVWIDAHGAPAAPPAPTLVGHDVVEPAAVVTSAWDAAPAPRELTASEPPPPLEGISLAPPKPLEVEPRGFFAGDELLLELVLVDRRDGTPLWRKVVHRDVDPTDGPAVKAALRAAIAEGTWMPATDLVPAPRS